VTARVTSAVLATSLIRQAQSIGGAAAVLSKGDAAAGSILISILEKGQFSAIWERILTLESGYKWAKVGSQDIENNRQIEDYLSRRRAQDPDLWVIELDVPDAERFTADMASGS
jgi:hypothetical protein